MFSIGVLLVIVFGLILIYDYFIKRTRNWKLLNKFPGDYPLPLVGNALQLGFDADAVSPILLGMWKKHGKTNFRLSVGSEEWVMLCEPDDVGVILSHPTELSKPLERNEALRPFFGNSLSTSEDERWRSMRKLMTPSFHFKTLENKLVVLNEKSQQLLEILKEQTEKGPVELYRYLRPYMFDNLCNTLMGVDYDLMTNPDHPYLNASQKVINIATINYFSYWRNVKPLFAVTHLYREMMETIKTIRTTSGEIITRRRKILEEEKETNNNNNEENKIDDKTSDECFLLDNLIRSKLPNGNFLPDEPINEEVTLLCYTGHYTTTCTIVHTLYCLAKYPEIQAFVMDEQRSIFNNDLSKHPTLEDLNDMKYLEAVIKESMRVIPTVTKIGRQLNEDLKLKDGRVIPVGTSVIVYFEALFQNPKSFPEPEKYKPERFFNNLHQYAFCPFSAGPRNCIGFRYAWIAMKATLSNILRRFEVSPGPSNAQPDFAHRIITESINGVHLTLKERKY